MHYFKHFSFLEAALTFGIIRSREDNVRGLDLTVWAPDAFHDRLVLAIAHGDDLVVEANIIKVFIFKVFEVKLALVIHPNFSLSEGSETLFAGPASFGFQSGGRLVHVSVW